MAGIYIHIPFCRSRCIYCDFYSTTSLELRQRYVEAVGREIESRGKWREVRGERIDLSAEGINTIYLGGGTPSQLTMDQLRQLFIYINKVYPLTSPLSSLTPEITIEANPDDVTPAFAEGLRTLPVNRVSMGAQTFSDERLKFLHRRHTAGQVSTAVERLRAAGIMNISVDLMYGFPGETLEDWESDIQQALALGVEHLSAYCLMIEEGTPLHQLRIKNPQLRDAFPSEETEREMYETLINRLEAAGYEHYEISNFAKPGFRSRHNSSYWDGTPYIGIGAAAHSFDGKTRSWNVSDLREYIEGMERGERRFEEEAIDEDTRYNDLVTTALRTREGLNLDKLSEKHRKYCIKNARRFADDGLVKINGSYVALTRRGLFVSDMIMSELMFV